MNYQRCTDAHIALKTFSSVQNMTELFGNFVLGGESARALCLLISQQLLALELSFKFV